MKILTFIVALSFIFGGYSQTYAQVINLQIISRNADGDLGDDESYDPSISRDGHFVVFASAATNLVPDDTNGVADTFVYDIEADALERVSINNDGEEADDYSYNGVVSGDGRYVLYASSATNLVPGDTNGVEDIFLYDRDTNTVELISVADGGGFGDDTSLYATMTPDARYIVFTSLASNIISGDTNSTSDIFVRDRVLETTERVSLNSNEEELDAQSGSPTISSNGLFVAFESLASNAAPGGNPDQNVYLRDLTLGTTELISVNSDGDVGDIGSFLSVPNNLISDDGRYVLFGSNATNLYIGDTNGSTDVFVRDTLLGTTELVSVSTEGVFGDDDSVQGSLDPGGRFASFRSQSDLLDTEDATSGFFDLFIRDLDLGTTTRISVNTNEVQANGESEIVGMFPEGARYFTYYSEATNLVSGDTNGTYDIFLGELIDDDGVSSSVEDGAPNSGDVDENDYDDAIEKNITSFVNSVSGNYSTIKTTGDCISNSNPSAVAENTLGSQDPAYDYPLGIISFEVGCKNAGETATISVYCFCEVTPVDGTIARKYDEDTGEYTTIDSAVIEEVTIGGQRALKMTYDVVDGGELDEDGLSNGTIIDPVGFARVATSSGGGSSSGSRPRTRVAYETNNQSIPSNNSEICTIFTTPMKKGSKFGEVSKLQTELNRRGFSSGMADGLFGPMTDTAVKAFQKSKTLIADGVVGPITRASLNDCK